MTRGFDELTALVRPDQVVSGPEQLRTYECDGLTGRRVIPALVLLPERADEVARIVRTAAAHGIPFVARGAGSGVSGGALPVAEGIVISLARMTAVLEVDVDRGLVVVEAGVTNLDVTRAVRMSAHIGATVPAHAGAASVVIVRSVLSLIHI